MLPPVLRHMLSLGYAVFENGDYNLNLFGVRSLSRDSNEFDDYLGCAYKDNDMWRVEWWEATTDPGQRILAKPINKKGAAILRPGQYRGAYRLGLHSGKYKALCQRGGPVKVWRDPNKDNVLDMDDSNTDEGYFGINIHKRIVGEHDKVNGASAGCQVFRYQDAFERMMYLAHRQVQEHTSKSFTYTLLDQWWEE